MQRNQKQVSDSGMLIVLMAIINAIVLEKGLVSNPGFYWLLLLTCPLFFITLLKRR